MKNLLYNQTILLVLVVFLSEIVTESRAKCKGTKLKYLYGDALADDENCRGSDGSLYPRDEVRRFSRKSGRSGRAFSLFSSPQLQDPLVTRRQLLDTYIRAKDGGFVKLDRSKREADNSTVDNEKPLHCGAVTPPRLCKSTFNTTAPMYGVSLTSGEAVTIVQKFPDLLQQVVYETCDSKECDLLHGDCIQTYIPYLFLVIPLGPVTLTGQDYVLVESGCTCRPKYARLGTDPNPTSVIPKFGK